MRGERDICCGDKDVVAELEKLKLLLQSAQLASCKPEAAATRQRWPLYLTLVALLVLSVVLGLFVAFLHLRITNFLTVLDDEVIVGRKEHISSGAVIHTGLLYI